MCSRSFRGWLLWPAVFISLVLAPAASAVVVVDWVTVGDPGNAGDPQETCSGCSVGTTFGAVAEPYRISKFEVTNAQYAEFLNAVAAGFGDLYHTNMGTGFGGITRTGAGPSGQDPPYTYNLIAGRENMPVSFVSFYDALRFANWLHNGQLAGAQNSTTTEDGAYTMIVENYPSTVITRNAGATVFLPNEDEWYKAAYYKGGGTSAGYWNYPAGSDVLMTCAAPGATANTANCNSAYIDLTNVGSYSASDSPHHTFDQLGNVWEWNEAIISVTDRGVRGASFNGQPAQFGSASFRWSRGPTYQVNDVGFRVASLVPAPPPVPSLSLLGLATLCSFLGLAGLRRRLA